MAVAYFVLGNCAVLCSAFSCLGGIYLCVRVCFICLKSTPSSWFESVAGADFQQRDGSGKPAAHFPFEDFNNGRQHCTSEITKRRVTNWVHAEVCYAKGTGIFSDIAVTLTQ